VRVNQLKRKLAQGEVVFGPFVRIGSPAIIEIMGHAGFDFAIIDLEHGPMSVEKAEDMVRAATCAGISPIIRVTELNQPLILRALDTGADGVQIPQINNKEAAQLAAVSARYYPHGDRGVCRCTRAAEYSHIPASEYFEMANRETLTIVHIEGIDGVKQIDKILEVPNIDVIFLGPYDLSQSVGCPGKVNDPKVVGAMEEIVAKTRAAGKYAGTYADSTQAIKHWTKRGVQYVASYIDTLLLYEAAKDVAAKVISAARD
jgi:4-hydroxy-2-oxoheptanedioate aldolase